MSDNITREPYRNAWYKQLSDAVKKHDEEIAEMAPHLVPEVEEGDNGKILIAGEDGAFDWGQPPEELPVITEGDEGKVLKVDEGVPKWLEDTDSEWLLVNITRSGSSPNFTYTTDKTYDEIRPYAEKGKCALLFNKGIYFVRGLDVSTNNTIDFEEHIYLDSYLVSNTNVNGMNEGFAGGIQQNGFTIKSDNTIEPHLNVVYFLRRFTMKYNDYFTEDVYNKIKTSISVSSVPYLRYTVGSKMYYFLFSSSESNNTIMKFYNYELGLEATIGANRYCAITEIPKLPTPTSADEGKVLMVDSNGDYVLGTVASGFITDYSVLDVEITEESEE